MYATDAEAVEKLERTADALLDLLSKDTPASRLVYEQLVIVLAAATRELWSDLRQRSGPLGSGPLGSGPLGSLPPLLPIDTRERSLLGSLVDPIGLFRSSTLIVNDERDKMALQAAVRLLELTPGLLPEVVPAGAGSNVSTSTFSEADQQRLLRALVSKAWLRRDDVQQAARRMAYEALDQTATRLAVGSRREIQPSQ